MSFVVLDTDKLTHSKLSIKCRSKIVSMQILIKQEMFVVVVLRKTPIPLKKKIVAGWLVG